MAFVVPRWQRAGRRGQPSGWQQLTVPVEIEVDQALVAGQVRVAGATSVEIGDAAHLGREMVYPAMLLAP
jgi:hypothetical protein